MTDPRPDGPTSGGILPLPIHHVGFHVPDLRAAIGLWVDVHRAGPFHLLEHVPVDECSSRGTAVVWDHSAAFGQCGSLPVELQQVHDLQPQALARELTVDGRSAVNHVGIAVGDPAAESARLQSLGFDLVLYSRIGEAEFFWHDAIEAFGYCLEVIQAGPDLDAFFGTFAEAARGWDGRDPIRSL